MSQNEMKISNEKIEDYLKFYIELRNTPGFAVLVDGEWGSGKTWFINKFIEKNNEAKFIYVSLYGVSSVFEIEEQFFQQLHPVLSSKPFTIGAKILRGVVKGTLKVDLPDFNKVTTGAEYDVTITEGVPSFLKDTESRILVFDDIERCKLNHVELLGYINNFVEHQGQKVILLANEKEIPELDEYKCKKEKLIGRRFKITAEIDSAFTSFISTINDKKLAELISENKGTILEVYKSGNHKNLRTLKQSMIEYERFFTFLPDQAKKHKAFQEDCIRSFFAINMELRKGTLSTSDIRRFSSDYYRYLSTKKKDEQEEENILAKTVKTYFNSSPENIAPNEESLFYFFEFGTIPNCVMENAIDKSKFFVTENTPAWVKLWRLDQLSDEDFEVCYKAVLKHFISEGFTKQGELKHVVGILIALSKNQIVDTSMDSTMTLIDEVLDKMLKNKKIEMATREETSYERFDNAYAGLCFYEYESPEFKKIAMRLREHQGELEELAVREDAIKLIGIVKEDSKLFFRVLTISNSSDQKYYDVPILKYIDSQLFVKTWSELPPENRMDVLHTIEARYEYLSSTRNLVDELEWLKSVRDEIDQQKVGFKQPTKYYCSLLQGRIINAIKHIDASQSSEVKG